MLCVILDLAKYCILTVGSGINCTFTLVYKPICLLGHNTFRLFKLFLTFLIKIKILTTLIVVR